MEWESCYEYFLRQEQDGTNKNLVHKLQCGIIAAIGKEISKKVLRSLLDQYDPNWIVSQEISLDTFIDIVLVLNEESNFEINAYKLLDRKNRGYIEFHDFERFMYSICPEYGRNHARELFDKADIYGVGKVTRLQFMAMMKTIHDPNQS